MGKIKLEYIYEPAIDGLEKMFHRWGWYDHDRVIFRNIVEIKKFLELDWVKKSQLPDSFVPFSWNTLGEHELRELKAAEGDWNPKIEVLFGMNNEQTTKPVSAFGIAGISLAGRFCIGLVKKHFDAIVFLPKKNFKSAIGRFRWQLNL